MSDDSTVIQLTVDDKGVAVWPDIPLELNNQATGGEPGDKEWFDPECQVRGGARLPDLLDLLKDAGVIPKRVRPRAYRLVLEIRCVEDMP